MQVVVASGSKKKRHEDDTDQTVSAHPNQGHAEQEQVATG